MLIRENRLIQIQFTISYSDLFRFLYDSFQCSTTVIYFTETLWPEFTIWHLLAGIFYYQQNQHTIATARRYYNGYVEKPALAADKERVEVFVNQFEKRRTEHLKNLVRNGKMNRSFAVNELTNVEP